MQDSARDRVFVSMNATKKVLGVDYRIGAVAAALGVVIMPFAHSLWRASAIAIVVWIIGAVCEKRDPRFFDLLPLRFQLKDRYEAGPK